MNMQAGTAYRQLTNAGGKVFLCQLTNTNLQPRQNRVTATTKGRDEMNDKDAIAAAQALYRAACERFGKRVFETVGEIANVNGARVAVLFDSHGKMAGAYRVSGETVTDLGGPELTKLRGKLANRKVR
jgi:hypothetical protein